MKRMIAALVFLAIIALLFVGYSTQTEVVDNNEPQSEILERLGDIANGVAEGIEGIRDTIEDAAAQLQTQSE